MLSVVNHSLQPTLQLALPNQNRAYKIFSFTYTYFFMYSSTVARVYAQGRHAVFSNHQLEWLVSVSAALWSLCGESEEYPLDKLKRRQDTGRDGLACSKWPQGSHFPQCSNSPGTLVLICLLWAKVSETHCGHHGLEEIWQIQKTDPVCFSLERRMCGSLILYELSCKKHFWFLWKAVKSISEVSEGLHSSLILKKSCTLIKLDEFQIFKVLSEQSRFDTSETVDVIVNLLAAELISGINWSNLNFYLFEF